MVADLHPIEPLLAHVHQPTSRSSTTSRAPLVAVAALGLVIGAGGIVAAYADARHSTGQLHFALFWASFVLALVAVVKVGAHAVAGTRARVGLLLGFGALTFLPKFLMSVNGPVYFDEYGHLRHANDIAASGHLDVASHYLPIIRYYPGLEVLTAWIHHVTHVSTWHVGQAIVLLAHCSVLLVVFFMTRALGLSERAAFLAAIVYSANSSYLYFDTEFSYESLGLPLAFTTVAFVVFARRAHTRRASAWWCLAALPTGAGCITTHHISAAAMVAIVVVVAAVVPTRPELARSGTAQWGPLGVGLVLAVGFVLWLTVIAPATYDYLAPHVKAGLTEVGDVLQGRRRVQTFQNGQVAVDTRHVPFTGSGAPAYEIVAAFLAPVIVALATLAALLQAWRERRNVSRLALLAPFFLLTAFYFLSLPLALTVGGGETGHRAWGLAYLGVAVLAVSSGRTWRAWTERMPRRWVTAGGLVALVVVTMGNVAAGMNVSSRFPGPYAFGTDTRSRTAELDGVARWASATLPHGAKVVTDRFTAEVLTADTSLITPAPSDYGVLDLYAQGDHPSEPVRDFVAAHGFRYWILDTRIETMKPQQPFFQGYGARVSVNITALRELGSTGSYLHLLHRTSHYEIFEIVG